jgi:hypothetical protein
MTAQRLRVGQLVSACDADALAERSPTYSVRAHHGIVVALAERQAVVKWIDYRGLQHDPCGVPVAMLCAGTLDAAARTRVIHCRRTDTARPDLTPVVVPPAADPTIVMRELRITSTRSTESPTGLAFHTVHDANVALHALADAQEAFQSTFGPDPASAVSGADTVVVYRMLYTTVHRLEHRATAGSSRSASTALAS